MAPQRQYTISMDDAISLLVIQLKVKRSSLTVRF